MVELEPLKCDKKCSNKQVVHVVWYVPLVKCTYVPMQYDMLFIKYPVYLNKSFGCFKYVLILC
jgi:hypothetical protein